MRWKHYQTVDHPKWELQVGRGLFFYPSTNSSLQTSIFQIHQIFIISYFLQFNLFFKKKKYIFPKLSKNHPKICTKLPNGGYGNKQRDLASLKTWPRYWQKGRVKWRQNSLHRYPRLKTKSHRKSGNFTFWWNKNLLTRYITVLFCIF